MKYKMHLIAAAILCAGSAMAGGYVAPVQHVEPVVIVPATAAPFNWSGPYAGVTLGHKRASAEGTDTTTHPAEYKHHDAVTGKLWVPTDPKDFFPGCNHGNNTCPVPDTSKPGNWNEKGEWTGEWKHGVITEAWDEKVKDSWTETTVQDIIDNTNTYGVFAGYRYQTQSRVVIGAEANYTKAEDITATVDGTTYTMDMSGYGVEAQLGLAVGRALPYVAVGYANVDGFDGKTASLGLDYAVTDRFIVGAKYTKAKFGDMGGMDVENETFGLRAAFRF